MKGIHRLNNNTYGEKSMYTVFILRSYTWMNSCTSSRRCAANSLRAGKRNLLTGMAVSPTLAKDTKI